MNFRPLLRIVAFLFAIIWWPPWWLLRLLREVARNDPQAALKPASLNGYLNGHQGFRILWLCVLAVADPWLGHPPVNLQFVFGVVLLIAGMLVSELTGRKKLDVRLLPLFNIMNIWPDIGHHLGVANLKIIQYPILPFFFDFLALTLIIWGTGGVSSPFSQLLFFGAFAASFALHSLRRATAITCCAAVAYGLSVFLPYWINPAVEPWRSAWHGRVLSWDVAGVSVAHGFFCSPEDHDPDRKLFFIIAVTAAFLLLSGVMAGKAAREYNFALDGTLPSHPDDKNKNEPDS
jgi:hypothetical protein